MKSIINENIIQNYEENSQLRYNTQLDYIENK